MHATVVPTSRRLGGLDRARREDGRETGPMNSSETSGKESEISSTIGCNIRVTDTRSCEIVILRILSHLTHQPIRSRHAPATLSRNARPPAPCSLLSTFGGQRTRRSRPSSAPSREHCVQSLPFRASLFRLVCRWSDRPGPVRVSCALVLLSRRLASAAENLSDVCLEDPIV